jgi:hypothetical protein
MKSVVTPKGTNLPLLDLKGKAYLQVAHRLVWFREDHPDWSIKTELKYDNTSAVSRAEIINEKGIVVATAHKKETAEGFYDFIEKAETGSVGRALAMCGYGTQFTDDLDEGDRIVDAPTPRKQPTPQPTPKVTDPAPLKYNGSPVAKILKACEVNKWDKKDAGKLAKEKFGDWQFSNLSPIQIDWLLSTISEVNAQESFDRLKKETQASIKNKPVSAMFDENNPPPFEEDIPF